MNTFYDVQQLLRKFGIFVYTKDQEADCELMEFELHELNQMGMISSEDYIKARLIIRKRISEQS